jgi:hypothetical protein
VTSEIERRRRARRSALLLGLLAIAVYVGFYLVQLAA